MPWLYFHTELPLLSLEFRPGAFILFCMQHMPIKAGQTWPEECTMCLCNVQAITASILLLQEAQRSLFAHNWLISQRKSKHSFTWIGPYNELGARPHYPSFHFLLVFALFLFCSHEEACNVCRFSKAGTPDYRRYLSHFLAAVGICQVERLYGFDAINMTFNCPTIILYNLGLTLEMY